MLKMPKLIPFLLGAMMFYSPAQAQVSSQVPDRAQVPEQYKWHLHDIYADESLWQKDFAKLQAMLTDIARFKGRLVSSPQTLLECLELRDTIGTIGGKLYAYARMHRDENAADPKYQALTGKVETLLAQAGAATAFIEPEILTMDDKTIHEFRQQEAGLKPYSFYFLNLAKQKKHVLSSSEEEILSLSSEVTSAPHTIFNMLAHADMKFPDVVDAEGKTQPLSEGRYHSLIVSPDRSLRKDAFTKLLGTYSQYRNTLGATLGSSVKKNAFYSKIRKYNSTLEANLDPDNVPLSVYNNLVQTVSENLAPLHRYVKLKRQALKLDEIHMYDLYTPVSPLGDFTVEYPSAINMVKDGLAPLGPEYSELLNLGLTSGWIDVYENKGKQTGAYSWGSYGVHPFVLLNYSNRYNDASTLAHEMGHAIHSYYSQANQPYITSSYTTFCAEVASTTNEVLLLDYMLKNTQDKNRKIYLINQFLETVRGTVYRQTMFAEFEQWLYEVSEKGETITADLLENKWHELNVKYYGPDIVVDKDIDIEWARIPHFYSSFYVYQYVTGYSAATTIAEGILANKPSAQENYLAFLKSGGSDYSIELLKKAGVDMSSPQPIEITLKKFSHMLDELEKLLAD